MAATAAVTRGAVTAAERLTARLERIMAEFDGHAVVNETSGRVHSWNTTLHKPQPDTVYVVDGKNVYVTDAKGRVARVEGEWEPTSKPAADPRRNEHQQKVAGRDDRQKGDVGGHIIAASGGGPGEGINLVAMKKAINGAGGDYGKMEAEIRSIARQRPGAVVELRIELQYSGDSARPVGGRGFVYVDGERTVRMRFKQ